MERDRRSPVVGGVVLILLGLLFLAVQLVPGLSSWINADNSWPLIMVAVGAILLIAGLVSNTPGMVIPGCIVGGIGALLYYQNATGNWESWSYAWALIPGFVGVGTLLAGLLGQGAQSVRGGLWLILISAVLFVLFGSFFGAFGFLGAYWPVLLILLGLMLLTRSFVRGRA